jgi:hypothetical protein
MESSFFCFRQTSSFYSLHSRSFHSSVRCPEIFSCFVSFLSFLLSLGYCFSFRCCACVSSCFSFSSS